MKRFIKNGYLGLFGMILFIVVLLLSFLGTTGESMNAVRPFIIVFGVIALSFILTSVLFERV